MLELKFLNCVFCFLCTQAVQSGRNPIQSTPVVDNLLENAALEEHNFSTAERINYDSPLNSVLNITKSGSFGTNRSV